MCATGKKIKEEVTECYKIKCGHLRNVNIFCLFLTDAFIPSTNTVAEGWLHSWNLQRWRRSSESPQSFASKRWWAGKTWSCWGLQLGLRIQSAWDRLAREKHTNCYMYLGGPTEKWRPEEAVTAKYLHTRLDRSSKLWNQEKTKGFGLGQLTAERWLGW